MKKLLIFAAAAFLLGGIFYYQYPESETPSLILIGDKAGFALEIADDPAERAQGLSYRDSLPLNKGMLFVFEKPQDQFFWMFEMNFPLDFVWINGGRVIGMDENIPHPAANGGEIYRVYSPDKADMVLEINSGLIERYGIKVGDPVKVLGLTE